VEWGGEIGEAGPFRIPIPVPRSMFRGLGPGLGDSVVRGLLALSLDAPANEPPLGAVTIPPLVVPEETFLHKGSYAEDTWSSAPLGMQLHLPRGFRPDDVGEGPEAQMTHTSGAVAAFQVFLLTRTERLERFYLRHAVGEARELLRKRGVQLDYWAEGLLAVSGTVADAFTWRTSKGGFLRVAFAPACGGKATVVVLNLWGGGAGEEAIEAWLGRFRPPARSSAACRYAETATD
jgi:hypothetical protein